MSDEICGEVLLSRTYEPDAMRDRIRIERADPRARIAGYFMRRITGDGLGPWVTVTNEQPLVITFADDFGQRFVYRVGKRDAATDTYAIEWPD